MSNEVARPIFGGIQVRDSKALAEALTNSAQQGQIGAAPDGSEYMNFSGKRGVYEFGQSKADIDPDELWVVNIHSFQQGYVCWKGGRPVARRMASIYDTPIPAPDPQEHGPFDERNGEGWHLAKALVVKSLDEDDRQGFFANNSKSGVAVISDLQDAIAQRVLAGMAEWPVISWDKEKFQARGNWNYKPKVVIHGWLSFAALEKLAADPDSDLRELMEESENGGVMEMLDAVEDGPAVEDIDPAAKEPSKPAAAGRRRRL